MLTHGSLFTGIGGMDLGLERAGFQTLWQVEIDDYATKVLEKHWPHVQRFRDITQIDWGTVPRVDLLSGGFPCQDISNAGKRAGITGRRSGLWVEFRRAIVSLRPRYVIVENVAALYQRGLDVVLGDLAASGYDAEWDCVPAAAVGAPHLRERIFIVANTQQPRAGLETYPGGRCSRMRTPLPSESAILRQEYRETRTEGVEPGVSDVPDAPSQQGRRVFSGRLLADVRAGGQTLADPRLLRSTECQEQATGTQQCGEGHRGYWETEPQLGRLADGIPRRVDRLKCLGNAIVPQVAEAIGRMILHAESAHQNSTNPTQR